MRVAVTTLAFLFVAGGALAQISAGGHIGLYSDNPGFSDCNLTETLYATNSIYAVHQLIPEASTAQFRIAHNWHGPVVGTVDYVGNLRSGNIYTGVTIVYGGCKPLPHLLARMDFVPTTATPPCTAYFFVVPDPAVASGQIEITECDSDVLWATGGFLIVNENGIDCSCGIWIEPPPWVGVEEATWGAVKALYQ